MNARPVLLAACLLPLGACGVERTITVDTHPPGAVVWINDKEIGRTPVETEFVHYGTYDVRLELDGYEPVSTSGKADAPWWDLPGFDFFAEVLPPQKHARVAWRYTLVPIVDDPEGLIRRARGLRTVSEAGAADGETTP